MVLVRIGGRVRELDSNQIVMQMVVSNVLFCIVQNNTRNIGDKINKSGVQGHVAYFAPPQGRNEKSGSAIIVHDFTIA
jgi:hypothetical protein